MNTPRPLTLAERLLANAELLDAMLDGTVRLDRRALDGLVRDLWEQAAEAQDMARQLGRVGQARAAA